MMNLLHWRLLVAIADAGSISRGAERVSITQSGASQAVAQLETALGFKVFARERREICVTALGEQVIENARVMLARLEAIKRLANESQGLGRGRIRLASFPSVLSTVLPPLLRTFRHRYPGIEVIALEGTDEEVEHWLTADTIDLGVVLNPAPERNGLVLGRDAWMAVVPKQHPLARRSSTQSTTLSELATQPFILATGGCAMNGQSLAQKAGLRLNDVRVTVRDWISACVLVREGLGVSLVPESTLPSDRHGLRIMPLEPTISREFGLVCSDAGRSSRLVRALLDELAKAV